MIYSMHAPEEILALDLLTLREHTERAGDLLTPESQAEQIRISLQVSELCYVRRAGQLVAYAMLGPLVGTSWFVRGFNTHPEYRTAPVFRELFAALSNVVKRERIAELRSNVYKTNRLSIAFHRKLGFRVTNENRKALEFVATVQELAASRAVQGL